MQLDLYKIHIKSIIKICSIGLVGYLPLMLLLTITMLSEPPHATPPHGVIRTVGWGEVVYANFNVLLLALVNLLAFTIGLWVWSRFFAVLVEVK